MENHLLNIMFEMHVQQTGLSNPPFKFVLDFIPSTFDLEKFNAITSSELELNSFSKSCFEIFKSKYKTIPFGSVHLNQVIWTKFALKSIILSYIDKSTTVTFPNGCCSNVNNCPINLFYSIVLQNLILETKEN